MILQLNRLGFSHHNHNHHMSEASLASLQAFRSQVTEKLHQMLPILNNEFAKLMAEIDYPVISWEAGSIDEYLDYTINLLELLNAISSSLSGLNHARVSLSHALSHIESSGSPAMAVERFREITGNDSMKGFKASGGDEGRNRKGKERIFHEALILLQSTGFWVCGVVLSGLNSDALPIGKIMRNGTMVDSIFSKKINEERRMVKEVEEVNAIVRMIVSEGIADSDAAMDLKRRLEVVRNGLNGLKVEEQCLFAEVIAARNEVIETLRRNN
ncbi:hypothetical protein LXL04_034156 [Taraxacum kok-saghyz]